MTSQIDINCLVLQKIATKIPSAPVNTEEWITPDYIQLADPTYYSPSDVDVILGAELFWSLIGNNQFKLNSSGPILRETLLGWVVTGTVPEASIIKVKHIVIS